MAKAAAFRGGQSSPPLLVVSGTCLPQTCLVASETSFGIAEGREWRNVKR